VGGLSDTKVGIFQTLMNQAMAKGWTIVSMKNDWKRIWFALKRAGGV
jgi:hypothetical protein